METIGIAVCDDEKFVHEEVERLFSNYQNKEKFSYKLYHCFSAEKLLNISKQVEIILLDIDMPQIDGIEAARKLAKKGEDKCIIMLTGKRERFKEAIKIGVVRFVTKPIEKDEFFEAIDYAFSSLMGFEMLELSYEGVHCLIQQRHIQVIESHRDYLKIYTKERIFESNYSFRALCDILDKNLFVMTHRSYMINLMHVCGIENKEKINMECGITVPISRRNKKEVIQKIIDFDKFKK